MNLALGLFSVFAVPLVATGAAPTGQDPVEAAIGEQFSVSEWTIQGMDLPAEDQAAIDVPVVLDGKQHVLSLFPHSVRTADFQLLVEAQPGVLVEREPAPPRTFRGTVSDLPESSATASLIDGQLYAIIEVGDGAIWGIQPLSEVFENAPRATHVVFHSDDLLPVDGICGTDDLRGIIDGVFSQETGEGDPNPSAVAKQAEIAIDADNEYYVRNSRSVPRTVADIEDLINRVQVIYERDVDICYKITKIIVRESEPDPYSSTNPETLLFQFRNHWNAQQGGVQRDTAHLMTGKRLNGNVIGISFLSTVCSRSTSYAVSAAKFTSNIFFRTGLVAHEIGHSWSAQHCNSRPNCRIMCSGLGGCTGIVTSFGPDSINSIVRFRNSRRCLGDCGPQVTCNDIKKLKAKCKRNGVIKGRVILFNFDFDGAVIKVEVDGEEQEVEIKGRKAKFSDFFFDPGRYYVKITDPPNCGFDKRIRCQ